MNAPLPPDPYRALGVESSADAGSIKTAYRKLVLKCHPDKFPDPTLKAQKQEEFQKVQQAYEILGDDDRRRDYDLELKAKKLKEELAKRGGSASANTPAQGRYVNVNIRTAEPPPGWSPSKHSTSKSSPYKPYSKEFSQSWEHEIPSRSKVYHDDERRARRTASYEKPKREDSRERRKREDDREREKRRDREQREHVEELVRKEARRQQKERDAAARERERERKDRKAREERDAARAKDAKKMREREQRERERDLRRKQEAEEKARAKSKPYLEHPPYSDEDDDVRRSRAKKSSSPKKQSDSPNRDKSAKQRDRSNPLETVLGEDSKYLDKMAFAASYIKNKTSKTSKTSPRHTAEAPTWSPAYPDPNEKWAPKRRDSGDGKHAKDEPIIVDAPEPDKAHPEVVSPSSNTQQAPPRLQKSHTMPTGYLPQTQTTAPVPPRVPLNRAFTMQPEHEYNRPAEKHRSARKRPSFDDDLTDYYQAPIQTRYHVSSRDSGVPRIIDTKYRDPYAPAPGVPFSKVKTAPSYGAEHVATSRRYEEDDVMTADYGHSHMQPQYDYRTAAVR
jgi:curved DNA-binding protein CbpA